MTRTGRRMAPGPVVLAVALVAAGAGMALPCAAQPGGRPASKATVVDGPSWSALTPAQQTALAPLKRDWQHIDATRKQKWLDIADRFPWFPPDERQRMQERMTAWSRMTPDERGKVRLQFQEVRKISPHERQTRWDDYMALPVEARQALSKYATTVPKAAKSVPAAAPPGQAAHAGKAPAQPALKPVAPTVVQARPGATTTLISDTAPPTMHAKAGQPKIAASLDAVDRRTLLPQSGPQGAAAARAVSAKPPSEATAR